MKLISKAEIHLITVLMADIFYTFTAYYLQPVIYMETSFSCKDHLMTKYSHVKFTETDGSLVTHLDFFKVTLKLYCQFTDSVGQRAPGGEAKGAWVGVLDLHS